MPRLFYTQTLIALFISVGVGAQSTRASERSQIAVGLTATGCAAQARQNVPCHFELLGPITRAQADAFETFLLRRSNLHDFELTISSSSGDLAAAMKLGAYLRDRGASVTARGDCATACVLVLAGGVRRYLHQARVVIDHPYPDNALELGEDRAEHFIEAINNPVALYLEHMEMPGTLLAAMLAVPAHETRELSAAELREYRLGESPGQATMPP